MVWSNTCAHVRAHIGKSLSNTCTCTTIHGVPWLWPRGHRHETTATCRGLQEVVLQEQHVVIAMLSGLHTTPAAQRAQPRAVFLSPTLRQSVEQSKILADLIQFVKQHYHKSHRNQQKALLCRLCPLVTQRSPALNYGTVPPNCTAVT